jgi:Flp pilus assembly protein TadG
MRVSRGPDRREGASCVELAIILPVLLIIVVGAVDFGRFAYHYIAVTNAARAGAEHATMTPFTPAGATAWQAAVQQTARDEMTNQVGSDPDLLTTTATVFKDETGAHLGLRRVRVVATYDSFTTLISWPGVPDSVALSATVEMRMIR